MEEKSSKKLTFFDLFTMSIGGIIGSGIFVMLPSVVGMAGRSVSVAMMCGAVVALFLVVPPAMISSTINLPGGNYSTGIAMLNPWLGGLNGLMQLFTTLAIGSLGSGLASYTAQVFPGLGNKAKVVALVYFAIFFLLAVKGTKSAAWVQNAMTVVLVAALAIFIVGGLPKVQPGYFRPEGFMLNGWAGFIPCIAMLVNSSQGGGILINFTNDTKNPKKTIPLAMIVSTLSVAGIYFLMCVITAGGIVPIEEVVAKGNLGVVAERFLSGPFYMFFMIGGAVFALATSLNTAVASMPYPWIKMADDGWLPKFIALRDKKFHSPYVILIIGFVVGAFFPTVLGLDIVTIVSLFLFPSQILGFFISLSIITLPKRFPKRWAAASFHVPMPILVLFALLSAASNIFLVFNFMKNLSPQLLITGLGGVIVLGAYVTWRYKAGYVNVDYIKEELNDDPERDAATM